MFKFIVLLGVACAVVNAAQQKVALGSARIVGMFNFFTHFKRKQVQLFDFVQVVNLLTSVLSLIKFC